MSRLPQRTIHICRPQNIPNLQGSANLRGPGSENKRINGCVILPAADRRTQLFHLIFTQPGPRGFAYPCRPLSNFTQPIRAVLNRKILSINRPLPLSVQTSLMDGPQRMSTHIHNNAFGVVWKSAASCNVEFDIIGHRSRSISHGCDIIAGARSLPSNRLPRRLKTIDHAQRYRARLKGGPHDA